MNSGHKHRDRQAQHVAANSRQASAARTMGGTEKTDADFDAGCGGMRWA